MNVRKVIVIVLVAIVAFLVYRAFRPAHYKNLPPTATGEWVAFGDSITAGFGASERNDYPTLLSQQLGVTIRNMGVPGNTTKDGLARLQEVIALKPRVVLLCLGGNDGLQGSSSDQMIQNLAEMIDRFHEAGSFVVLIGVHSASFRDTNGKRFKQLAEEKEVFYVPDILDGVLGHPALMSDYIHPNEAGYKVIAERLERLLFPLLPQIKS